MGRSRRYGKPNFIGTGLVLGVALMTSAAMADVGLAGILGRKALLVVDGGPPQAVPVGSSLNGIQVVAVQEQSAVIDIGGQRRTLRVGQHAIGESTGESEVATLTADPQGHFLTLGSINGQSMRFLVDTGATMISLGASDARRLGLDPAKGQRGLSQTANGQILVTKVRLDTVRIGGITLYGVDALIHGNDLPIALLGMSFLNRMDMQRDGSTMTLKKRY